jgi:hypothetical protein
VSSVHGYGTSDEEQGSARDRTSNDPLLKELDNNVDIDKDKIKQAMDGKISLKG